MRKFDVQIMLEKVADARATWSKAQREFQTGVDRCLAVLVHEAAKNYMSVGEIAKASGMSPKRVRTIMRLNGLNPSSGKRLLSETASKALTENAQLLGIKPHEMDLTSPLAYLPMGNDLRNRLNEQQVSKVTEFPETPWVVERVVSGLDELFEVYAKGEFSSEFIATFNDREDADRVVALVNGA